MQELGTHGDISRDVHVELPGSELRWWDWSLEKLEISKISSYASSIAVLEWYCCGLPRFWLLTKPGMFSDIAMAVFQYSVAVSPLLASELRTAWQKLTQEARG